MSEIAAKADERNQAVRARLVKQSADQIDMGDYLKQLRVYQEIILEVIEVQGLLIKVLRG